MARLTLDDGGTRRKFTLNPGKIIIGSGKGCTLRLAAPDVAELHAELEFTSEEEAILTPRPGVAPPTFGGKPVSGPTRLPADSEFRIGQALFTIGEGIAKPAAPAVESRGPRRAAVTRTRRTVKRGLPTWGVVAILVGGAGVVYLVGRSWLGDAAEVVYSPHERLRVATENFNEGAIGRAELEISRIDLDLAPELRPQVEALQAKIGDREASARVAAWNVEGSKHFETQLKGFVNKYMLGDNVPRERARVFIKRCEDFRKRWPQHPELTWVNRYQTRYASIAKMHEPATFTDVAYEIKTLTWAKPRDYRKSFALLGDFEQGASSADYDACTELRDTLEVEREAYFTDRMQQAKWHWERNETGQSVATLVELIIGMGDAEMVDQAAHEFVRLPGIEDWLKGYRSRKPEKFQLLVEQPAISTLAREQGLL
ncbi:MAG: FHA domain-containing protein [Planctomycetota bacterium]|jgi:hypothetical protein|nr:FHA domain-containing protein [Planctomycetota bacterium]MDP6988438.1 FHA domain-containing protein [Planctomycetota bacterium]